MSIRSYLRRLGELRWKDRLLLAEATAALAAASFAIRAFPFRSVMGAVSPVRGKRVQDDPAASRQIIDRTRWAVEACGRVLPWKIVCFQKGLALHWLLHRQGVATVVHYGVAQDPARGLAAHVWVTHEGQPVIGGEEAPRFTCLATFPPRTRVIDEGSGLIRGTGKEMPCPTIRPGPKQ